MTTTLLSDSTIHSLKDLTNQESGIVVFPGGNIIVCNWSGFNNNTLPCVFMDLSIMDWPCKDGYFTRCKKRETDDLYSALCELGREVIWDLHNDVFNLANSDTPTSATVYELEDGEYIFAPHGWN